MFTAPRLVAAVILAGVGYVASEMIKPLAPEGTQFGIFSLVNVALGALVGWFVIGSRIGRGMAAAISYGLTGTVVLIFWGLFTQSVNEMLRLALRRRYKGPFEAITDIFNLGIDFAVMIATPQVLGTLFLGGVLAAVLAEFSAKHWR
ncbi:MAG: TrgA family protein [Rhodobacterales bacterium]